MLYGSATSTGRACPHYSYRNWKSHVRARKALGFSSISAAIAYADDPAPTGDPADTVITTVTRSFDNVMEDIGTSSVNLGLVPTSVTRRVEFDGKSIVDTSTTIRRPAAYTHTTGESYAVLPVRTSVSRFEDGERLVEALSFASNYTDFGRPQQLRELTRDGAGEIVHSLDVATTYRDDLDTWLVGLPTHRESLTCRDDECFRFVEDYAHDPETGALISGAAGPPDEQVATSYTYGPQGNVTSTTLAADGEEDRTTLYRYDNDERILPVCMTNPLGHSMSFRFDPDFQVVTGARDANGAESTREIDAMGRAPWGRVVSFKFLVKPRRCALHCVLMSRATRVEFPGACYHVMARGVDR